MTDREAVTAKVGENSDPVGDPAGQCQAIRRRLRLTQKAFAARFGLGFSTVRELEQRRFKPHRSVAVLLSVIDADPLLVARAVSSMAAPVK